MPFARLRFLCGKRNATSSGISLVRISRVGLTVGPTETVPKLMTRSARQPHYPMVAEQCHGSSQGKESPSDQAPDAACALLTRDKSTQYLLMLAGNPASHNGLTLPADCLQDR